SMTALDLARRPEASLASVLKALQSLNLWRGPAIETIPLDRTDTALRYSTFVEKENQEAERHKSNESRLIPNDIDYLSVPGLRIEASQRLSASRPPSLGHAVRTAGVTPSDIGALLIHLARVAPGAKSERPRR
ncbi:MAG: tRNA uridine-5-carboxymethylaminomethyl(34) synthesis enzyme MnmG, partial [Thermomicrobiales bacterium]